MIYSANDNRYQTMEYRRCGNSGLKLPAMSLGLWHNFGGESSFENARKIVLGSFDLGITHFDLANNYGPPAGSAEETFGRILNRDLKPYRDEIIVATKAGYGMWEGPYGDGGSKKYLVSSLDQSLKRMNLEYVDIFYHHRPDTETPLEETMEALALLIQQGKALYIGLSNYSKEQIKEASAILKTLGVRCLIHQHNYSMLNQQNAALKPVLKEEGIGSIAFCPLAQGLLTNKYIHGIPKDSRAAGNSIFLGPEAITEEVLKKIVKLNEIAENRNQNLAQMALAWALQTGELTSVILGASKLAQIQDNIGALNRLILSEEELQTIDTILLS
ncbi:aldo/keto reductase [Lachnoclostridium phytofermentans]|uniref:aldo/keto reductase n=1 Tax=Lachnoclostridium phytofermentans TaxID=66219 RepID=UPI000497563A|nr:aldo/keto reductase [Lachnoclostridium phytofermentans]